MSYEHDHLQVVGHWLTGNWAWISSIAVVLSIAAVWVMRLFWKNLTLPRHVTHAELHECEDGVLVKLEHSNRSVLLKLADHEREEFARTDEAELRHEIGRDDARQVMIDYRKENLDALNRMDVKIDKLTQTIIENLRNNVKK